jgi:hypothetical protein
VRGASTSRCTVPSFIRRSVWFAARPGNAVLLPSGQSTVTFALAASPRPRCASGALLPCTLWYGFIQRCCTCPSGVVTLSIAPSAMPFGPGSRSSTSSQRPATSDARRSCVGSRSRFTCTRSSAPSLSKSAAALPRPMRACCIAGPAPLRASA